jgi:ferredoxin
MRYIVDPALCCAHGQCFMTAPEVFHGDDEGYNTPQGVEVEVPSELEEQAREGAEMCPDAAIQVLG